MKNPRHITNARTFFQHCSIAMPCEQATSMNFENSADFPWLVVGQLLLIRMFLSASRMVSSNVRLPKKSTLPFSAFPVGRRYISEVTRL